MTTTLSFRRRRTAATLGLGAALLLSACGTSTDTSAADAATDTGYPVTVDDCAGEKTFEQKPESVMTIGTAAISLLDAAGASGQITARAGEFGAPLPDDLDTPPSDAEVVDPSDPTAESIIGAAPDVVYGYGLFSAKPEALEQAGIPMLTVAGECGHDASTGKAAGIDFSTVSDDVRRLGRVFGTSDVADENADALDATVKKLSAESTGDGASAAWLYYFSSSESLSAYGATSMANAVLDAADLENVFGTQQESYVKVSMESLLEDDPTWLVLSYGLYGESEADARKQLLAEPGANDLTAVKEGRLILVPGTSSEASQQSVKGLRAVVDALADGR
ncbi:MULTISPECIES: ABC transporter substrate-binding protein [unclassified Aeromicrobium]|jgi:iron complex transport system substrate-binding protein|uniref:ABC transporter substrate-binding protein n=1 Tax=unclassified Aeromicrobium TaxID=2633570 RepID=UPI002097510A|nr:MULTISPECIES: ABC transporter substrate-binding protein [unclassified Aeromicrobium]MCO7237908.1 ABC transporter substrate-binding protein [Aeromicrobium sp. CnD17-E]MDR6119699.1 iron complex transport system substrate-binding protein [Aeromicrobium sp. SORGH_AS_0981]